MADSQYLLRDAEAIVVIVERRLTATVPIRLILPELF
jgi:hypothetical protein